jgi:glycosyltransferase involved in cell wall biosynthesis
MRIIIYNSSSFGGCFDYGREIFKAFQKKDALHSCEWWIPENASAEGLSGVRKLFVSDRPDFRSKILKQIHFLYRTLMNPLLLYMRLAAAPNSVVIFNDFEQLSAPLWVPLFRKFLIRRHVFSVILHDPDRDAYPPSLAWTRFSMKQMMGIMDVAFFHGYLPEKSYYKQNNQCHFIDIPHGIFPMPDPDPAFLEILRKRVPESQKLLAIPGNIREEKNYQLAIEALQHLPDCHLLVAGSASNARVNIDAYKQQAEKSGVSNRLVWIEKYLSPEELAAVMKGSDVILLNYSDSFTSQSGIFNVAVPFRKPVVVSKGKSSLSKMVQAFGIGTVSECQDAEGLAKAIRTALSAKANPWHWDEYLSYASWEHNTSLAFSNLYLAKAASGR